MTAEPGILRGRRFGNLVLVAGHQPLPAEELGRLAHRDSELARLVDGKDLERFSSGHTEVHDADAVDSPAPPEIGRASRRERVQVAGEAERLHAKQTPR